MNCNRKSIAWPAAISAIVFTAGPALAGPPFLTDDLEPVEYQHHEFYTASQQTRTTNGATETLPHIESNYGAVPDSQLHIIAPYQLTW